MTIKQLMKRLQETKEAVDKATVTSATNEPNVTCDMETFNILIREAKCMIKLLEDMYDTAEIITDIDITV